MRTKSKLYSISLLIILCCFSLNSVAQEGVKVEVLVGAGAGNMRDFKDRLSDIHYQVESTDGTSPLRYEVRSTADYFLNAGIQLSDYFNDDQIFGWQMGLNVRTGGFRVSANPVQGQELQNNSTTPQLPDFEKTKSYRYTSLHVPISLVYKPFDKVGFIVGPDIYYQLTKSPTERNNMDPHGELGQGMGLSNINTPNYKHPWQFGMHLGAFMQVNRDLRLEGLLFSDLVPRLQVSSNKGTTFNFREMGAMMNMNYRLR